MWQDISVLPDARLYAVATSEDAVFGILQSRVHEVWSLAKATWHGVGNDPTYKSEDCYETFPFPVVDEEKTREISAAAVRLYELRERWLHPPEWEQVDELKFAARIDGPWRHLTHVINGEGVGVATFVRRLPISAVAERDLNARTLTKLYNDEPEWLLQAHRELDTAVFSAYGWHRDMNDGAILAALLDLNFARNAEPLLPRIGQQRPRRRTAATS